ncbi:MAG: hypothetical protein OXF46_03205 [Rhodobacteraceae bacterium]|nr:hypothetical protein [Paracoccaceae bacterium]
MAKVRNIVESILGWHLEKVASIRKSDVMVIYGPMFPGLPGLVREEIEKVALSNQNEVLTILLDTGGGLVDAVERTVGIIRHHYDIVNFVIPDQAMSAGTVFALSGDNIYMDYYSQLGPIDPQFYIEGRWIPGLGYMEKFEELNQKSANGTLTPLEFGLVDKLDLADLHQYEQAREHSVELLEKWLPAYKFKNWNKKESSGESVTMEMKKKRAKEIARKLNATKRWHAHSRGITMQLLREELNLIIEDMSLENNFHDEVKQVHSFILDHMETSQIPFCLRSVSYDGGTDGET